MQDKPNVIPRKTGNATRIAREIQASILGGTYASGAKLPGQRELATQFGASMPTIREAISMLAATGLIEVRHGSGSVVRSTSEAGEAFKGWLGIAANDKERDDFHEARLLVETFVVDKIIARGAKADFEPIYDALDRMEAALNDPAAYLEAGLNYHWEMARCAGNTVLVRMLDAIQLPMRAQIDAAIAWHLSETATLAVSFEDHLALLDALVAGDGPLAQETIRRMLNRAAKAPG